MKIPTVKECSTSTYAEQKMLLVSRKSFIAKKTCLELEVKGKSLTLVCRFVVVVMVRKVIIVSVHVRYFSFFSFFSLCLTGYIRLRRLHQVTSVYVEGTGRGARQLINDLSL